MMVDLISGIEALKAAVSAARLNARFAPTDPVDMKRLTDNLPMSPELIEWYEKDAPTELEIPWFAEKLQIYDPSSLLEWQEGYRWRVAQQGTVDPDWNIHWVVIGDWTGDPVIANTGEAGTPISMAVHGVGTWKPFVVARDLAAYLTALGIWIDVCLISHQGVFLNDMGEMLPHVRSGLEARLAPVLDADCREHWFSTD